MKPHLLRYILFSILLSISLGVLGALFNAGMRLAKIAFDNFPILLALLPFGGLWTVWVYQRAEKSTQMGILHLKKDFQEEKNTSTIQMPFYIVIFTWLTHLLGGSAGREGTALQMGGGIGAYLQRHPIFDQIPIKLAILMGFVGGFSAVFGTPCAALIFGLELVAFRFGKYQWLLLLALVTFGADFLARLVGPDHTHYAPRIAEGVFSCEALVSSLVIGALLGLGAWLFLQCMAQLKVFRNAIRVNAFLWMGIGSVLVVLGIYLADGWKYAGLGIGQIESVMLVSAQWQDVWMKFLLTVATLAAGFKGGEVTPLFFIGSHFGNCLSAYLPASLGLCTAVGFVSMFSGASKAPWACAVMGMEIFGWQYGFYFLLACLVASVVSGRNGLYDHGNNLKN